MFNKFSHTLFRVKLTMCGILTLLLVVSSASQEVTFSDELIISDSADGVYSVYAADLDGDGDQDVLAASDMENKIVWFENCDGAGNFGPQLVITTDVNRPKSVFAADIDGDGDQDVLSASCDDSTIAWYVNTDGAGNFGNQQIITTNADCAYSVFTSDLDGDGDQDVLSASWNDNIVGSPVLPIHTRRTLSSLLIVRHPGVCSHAMDRSLCH